MSFVTLTKLSVHDTTHSPLGLWQFNGDGNDSSGNARNLTPVGSPFFSSGYLQNGDKAWYNNSSEYNRTDSTFQLTGATTIMGLIMLQKTGAINTIVEFSASGETEVTNILYQLQVRSNGELWWAHEFGAGSDETFTTAGPVIVPGRWQHVTATRDSAGTTVKLFVNGVKVADNTFANAATGGSSSALYLGVGVGSVSPFVGKLRSFLITNTELSEAQVQTQAKKVLGLVV